MWASSVRCRCVKILQSSRSNFNHSLNLNVLCVFHTVLSFSLLYFWCDFFVVLLFHIRILRGKNLVNSCEALISWIKQHEKNAVKLISSLLGYFLCSWLEQNIEEETMEAKMSSSSEAYTVELSSIDEKKGRVRWSNGSFRLNSVFIDHRSSFWNSSIFVWRKLLISHGKTSYLIHREILVVPPKPIVRSTTNPVSWLSIQAVRLTQMPTSVYPPRYYSIYYA